MFSKKIEYKGKILDLSRPKIMGIVNVTPDSFSDGGKYTNLDTAFEHVKDLVLAGASIIDVGGESTRPGAAIVSEQEELDRVIPLVEKISQELDVWISVDTSKAAVMKEALEVGAHIINDIRSLTEESAMDVVAKYKCPVCLMHMQGNPQTMQEDPHYDDLIGDISLFLFERIHTCINAGIKRENIIIDPGFGFGKTLDQNYKLLGQLDRFLSFGLPLLVGMSRKSMIGNLIKASVDERLVGSIAAHLYAVQKGANILRVHDVKEMSEALKVFLYADQYSKSKKLY